MTASSEPPIGYELNRLFEVESASQLLNEKGGWQFPWLIDTLRYGKIPETWTAEQRIAVMNHLLLLISHVGESSYGELAGLQYAWGCFQAGNEYEDQEYDFSPVIESIKTTSDVGAISWLIACLEYTGDKNIFSRYVQPFANHSSIEVRDAVEEAGTRMKY